MFENLFSSSTSVWAGLFTAAVAIPILIHLINLMRHQTVRWAAMDFLLASHKKHRNWVWLKQLLLLLSRIAILLLALLLLAQIGCNDDRVARLLGGSTTHHYVLLDDSFSMQDRDLTGRAFDRATATLSKIAGRAKNRQNQKFTLLRYSSVAGQAAASPDNSDSTGSSDDGILFADINAELVDTQFDRRIESVKGELDISELSVGPLPALNLVADLIERRSGENAIVYVLSDFRKQDWGTADPLEPALAKIESAGAAVELINCAEKENRNLGIERLAAIGNVRVAETPLMVEIEVRNFSTTKVENVQVDLESTEYSPADSRSRPESLEAAVNRLPAVFIDAIEPGESTKQSFPVYFRLPGIHTITATLPDDCIAADNVRYANVEIKDSAKVLLVDRDSQEEGQLMSLVLNPGKMTGIETNVVNKAFLRDTSVATLNEYDVVMLLDIDRLDEIAVNRLETFVSEGGGVAFFVGPNSSGEFYRQSLYRNGQGVFPLPLDVPFAVPERVDAGLPDVEPVEHPIFAPALSVKNSLLNLVQIKQVWRPPIEWSLESNSGEDRSAVEILATVRGMDALPLVVAKRFGNGRSIAVLTTASPQWNNWMPNPTFLPIVLLMQDYLAQGKFRDDNPTVGERESIRVSSESYQRSLSEIFRRANDDSASAIRTEMELDAESRQWFSPERTVLNSGIREHWLTRVDGSIETRREPYNVDASEGNITLADAGKIVAQFEQAKPTMVAWDRFNPEPKLKPASSLSQILFVVLIGVMIGEQCLAYMTNYHR